MYASSYIYRDISLLPLGYLFSIFIYLVQKMFSHVIFFFSSISKLCVCRIFVSHYSRLVNYRPLSVKCFRRDIHSHYARCHSYRILKGRI